MSIQIKTIIRDETGREIRISKNYVGSLRLENLEAVESFMYQAEQEMTVPFNKQPFLEEFQNYLLKHETEIIDYDTRYRIIFFLIVQNAVCETTQIAFFETELYSVFYYN